MARHSRSVLLALAALGVAVLLASCGGSSAPPLTGKALVKKAIDNADAATSVHETILKTGSGASFNMDNDIGASEGRQMITVGKSTAEVLDVNGLAFIRANAYGLVHYFGLNPSSARWANTWISVPKGSSGYASVTDAVTLLSDFEQYQIKGKLTVGGVATIGGVRATPVHTSVKENGRTVEVTFYVTASGTERPVAEIATSGNLRLDATWSMWGEPLDLVAPKHSVPITTVLSAK